MTKPLTTAEGEREAEWRWFGCAGHFIGASQCQFHLHTRIGDYRVSTIGAYAPPGFTPTDERPFMDIGLSRTFETMVFHVSDPTAPDACPGEGEVTDWCGIDMEGYSNYAAATEGHLAMCRKYAALTDHPEMEDLWLSSP